jgi:glycerol uptake facilitator-like aquaporin
MLLVLVIVAVAADPKAAVRVAAVAIGFSLAAVVFACGPLTGASVNPARSLGPMIIAGRLPDWWCYILGP